MKLKHLLTLAALLPVLVSPANAAPTASPAGKTASPANTQGKAAVPHDEAPKSELRRMTLTDLSGQMFIPLRGNDGQTQINFNVRKDELVTKAVLNLHYTYSPALLPVLSHIKVTLNDEVIAIAPVNKDNAGKKLSTLIEMNPRLLSDFNRLKLQLIGHYSSDCEDPLHSSLWADISGNSEIELNVQHLATKDNLAILPEPFFDHRDNQRLNLPFVFAAHPSLPTLRAAGVTSSWFGNLAAWRGARFPAHLDRLPQGHAVVFASNTERPDFLKDLPPFTAPGLSVITNPADHFSKLLLISGRDSKDLNTAATALALGNTALTGTQAVIDKIAEAAPRQAYDAPKWVRLDRPMKFGELVESAQELQVAGRVPSTIRVNLRIPPDLFTWQSRGIAVDLKYRYTPPIYFSESRLNVSINDELVRSFNLRASGQGGESSRVKLPLLDEGLFSDGEEILIPSFKLGIRNQLQYNFSFVTHKQGLCRDSLVDNTQSILDADSTIDFSGFPHYAEMPHLGYFASLGFPFTKYADLSHTVVVMPDQPSVQDIEVLLTVLGHLSEATGYPATRFNIAGAKDEAMLKDADILVIGSAMQQPLLKKWSDQLPVSINGNSIKNSQPNRAVNFMYGWLGFTSHDPQITTQEQIEVNGSLAAILGFESPLTPEHSVVAITATGPEHLAQALDALDDTGLVQKMHGSVAIIRGKQVDSALVGATYTVGKLPLWTSIWYPLSKHPILLAVMAVLAIFIFAFALWRSLKAVTKRRLEKLAK